MRFHLRDSRPEKMSGFTPFTLVTASPSQGRPIIPSIADLLQKYREKKHNRNIARYQQRSWAALYRDAIHDHIVTVIN